MLGIWIGLCRVGARSTGTRQGTSGTGSVGRATYRRVQRRSVWFHARQFKGYLYFGILPASASTWSWVKIGVPWDVLLGESFVGPKYPWNLLFNAQSESFISRSTTTQTAELNESGSLSFSVIPGGWLISGFGGTLFNGPLSYKHYFSFG